MSVYEFLIVLSSFISLIIGFVAITLTRRTIQETRLYNKASIRPYLNIRAHFGGSQEKYGISVTNEGLGPALIKTCKGIIGSEFLEYDYNGAWESAVKQLNLSSIGYRIRIEVISPNSVISPGSRKWLFYIDKKK